MKIPGLNLFPAVAVLSLGSIGAAKAATVTWETPKAISGDSDVSTSGTGILAFDYSSTGNQTVNTVVFSTSTNQNGVTLAVGGESADGSSFVTGSAVSITIPATFSTAYKNMLTGAGFMWGASPMTVTLSGLDEGQDYQVQFWVADYRQWTGANYNRSETITAGNTSGTLTYLQVVDGVNQGASSGTYVIGNFTADGTGSQSFTMLGNVSTEINAFQLRAVPEPSTSLLGGLWALTMFRRRRV